MHTVAERHAVNLGPRISTINGQPRAAYYLDKKELRNLFAKNGFNTNGVAWLKMIVGFKEFWEELAPSQATILDANETWRVYFVHPCATDLIALKMFGENNSVPILAVEM